jgi:lysophospholipase L1-like esterase
MANKTVTELVTLASAIANESLEQGNSKARVGAMFANLAESSITSAANATQLRAILAAGTNAKVITLLGRTTINDGYAGNLLIVPIGAYVDDDQDVFTGGSLAAVRQAVITAPVETPVEPVAIDGLSPVCHWSASTAAYTAGLTEARRGRPDLWTGGGGAIGMGTPGDGVSDHLGTAQAWSIRETTANGYHYAVAPGVSGTTNSQAMVVEAVLRPVGGRWLYLRDAADQTPSVSFDGSVVAIVAGTGVTARVTALGGGWAKIQILTTQLATTADYSVVIATGDASNLINAAGDTSKGFDVLYCATNQNGKVTTIPNSGSSTAALTADATYPQQVTQASLISGLALWSPPSVYGYSATADSAAAALYSNSVNHSTVMTLAVDAFPSAAVGLLQSNLAGTSFAIWLDASGRIVVGDYNGTKLTSIDSVPIGRKFVLTVTHTSAGVVAVYVNDVLLLTGSLTLTPTPDHVYWLTSYGVASSELAIWNRVLTTDEIKAIVLAQLATESASTATEVLNRILWDTSNERRLNLAETRFALAGQRSVTIESSLEYAGYAGAYYGPAVIVDGSVVGVQRNTAAAGLVTNTYPIAAGASELRVRDGNGTTAWAGFRARRITLSGGAPTTPSQPARRLLVYGDSVSNGAGSTRPAVDGWTMKLRDTLVAHTELTVWGTGGLALYNDGASSGARTTLAALHAALIDGSGTNTIIVAIGINDGTGYFASWGTAAAFGTAYADYLDKLHAASPTTKILAVAMHTCTGGYASQIGQIRAQIVAAQSTRSSWLSLIDLSSLTVTMFDDLHPDASGHATIFGAIQTKLTTIGSI